jgi:hypothetical protein
VLTCRLLAVVIVVAAATASGPLAAKSYTDPASGLSIDPPEPFAAQPGQPHRQFDVTIDVASTSDERHCALGFKQLPENALATKAEINALMASPESQNSHRSLFEQTGTVHDLSTFEHQGYIGVEVTITPKLGPAAESIRMLVSTVATPKGSTALICITDKDSLAAGLPDFRALRATMRAPE